MDAGVGRLMHMEYGGNLRAQVSISGVHFKYTITRNCTLHAFHSAYHSSVS
jgi:hypothetical protein